MEFIRDLNGVSFNLDGFGALFESGIADGLFDQVEYNTDGSYPTFILHKDGAAICDIFGVTSSPSMYICPVFNPTVSIPSGSITQIMQCDRYKQGVNNKMGYSTGAISRSSDSPCLMRCKGGYVIYKNFPPLSSSSYVDAQAVVIGKTSSNKTGMLVTEPLSISEPIERCNDIAYVTVNGDSTSVPSAYRFSKMKYSSDKDPYNTYDPYTYLNLDRVILTQIPVPGQYGSNDYFSTAFFRAMDSFSGYGTHVINGKKYGVLGNWAVLDE